MRRAAALFLLLAACSASSPAPVDPDAPLSVAARAGKAIYQRGLAGDRPVAGKLAIGVALEGAAAACARCHGADGSGSSEGGRVAPALLPHLLFGQRGYDRAALARALGDGVDPAGRPLDSLMPRYRLEGAAIDALHAYLQRLATDVDPGVEADRIHVGTVLPAGRAGKAVLQALETAVAEVNAAGGIYRRRLVLVLASDPGAIAEEVLVLVAPAATVLPASVPAIGPLLPREEDPLGLTFDLVRAPAASAAEATAAIEVLAEALRRAGARPTRAAVVRALESLHRFETTGLPPLGFGPNRRLGIRQPPPGPAAPAAPPTPAAAARATR
ncbi:c-type cytochrome [Vulgatibacter sp.]|uniref:c-type cytochrome n=1 Tax=Vulgatibacter sp. TaxID=1971226 RepID=UPI003566A05A